MIFARDKGQMCNNLLPYGYVYICGNDFVLNREKFVSELSGLSVSLTAGNLGEDLCLLLECGSSVWPAPFRLWHQCATTVLCAG